MMLIVILSVLIAVMLAIILSRSLNMMNYVTVFHSVFVALFPVYLLVKGVLPAVFHKSRYLVVDTLGAYEILITGVIFFFAAIYAKGYVACLIKEGELSKANVKLFYLGYNSLLLAMVLAFSSNNLSVLWIFAEITTIVSAVLIVTLNAKENIVAAMKYVFITSTAMLFSFIGLILLFAASKNGSGAATLNWDALLQASHQIQPQLLFFSFVFIFIGFAAKSGIVPFHTWLPPSHSKAASDVSVLLSGSVLNIGIYAILRVYALVAKSSMGHEASMMVLVFGIITVGIASLSMLQKTNLKKLIAYSSVESMGFMLIGIAAGNIFWVLYFVAAHAMVKALLFFSAGIIHRQYGSMSMAEIKGVFRLQPLAALGLIIGSVAIIGTPLFPMFMPKFYIIASLAKASLFSAIILLLFLLIAAGSFVWLILQLVTMQGAAPEPYEIYPSMKIPILALILLLLVFGAYFPLPLSGILAEMVSLLGLGG
ncbi:TPA: hydrogenase membrane subunit [Candidatus Woesearchaeota archaeon]|nr:hydrogenase membrane subunit [Candidatus Woesearchaeota archaeon]HII68313.1 hydrogenase membrane subunit [Candidatus Woesearchaeota archaeon]